MKKLLFTSFLLMATTVAFAADYWQKIAVPTGKHLLSVSFGSTSTGYIGCSDSTLLRTTDGGKTWTSIKPSGMDFSAYTPDIIDVDFVSADTGFAVVSNKLTPELRGHLYKTTDGGSTWKEEPLIGIAPYRGFFFDGGNGFLVGSGIFSGSNAIRLSAGIWQPTKHLSSGSGTFLRALDCYNTNIGIAGGDEGKVYRTFDGGSSWDTVKTVIDTTIQGLLYISEDTIIAVTANIGAAVLVSNDKGKNWKFDPHSATFYYPDLKAIVASRKDSLIMVGKSITTGKGIIYHFGSPFMNFVGTDQDLNDVAMANDSVAFIAGDSGLLLSNRHITTSVKTPAQPVPVTIYPNPAPKHFFIQSPVPLRAAVYDAIGRIVLSLPDEATRHDVDLAQHPAGVYLIRITWDNEHAFWSQLIVE